MKTTTTSPKVKVFEQDGRLVVQSPYCPAFPTKAKALGGRWDPKAKVWSFDPRDEERVRALVAEVYGTDGTAEVETVTLRVELSHEADKRSELWIGSRCLARRADRDYPVRLGDGVILVAGGFARWGGSRKYPALFPEPGTVLEVKDLPKAMADEFTQAPPAWAAATWVVA